MKFSFALIVCLLLAACSSEEPAPDPEQEARGLLQEGRNAEGQGDLGKAEALFAQILARHGQSATAKEAQASIVSIEKKCDEAAVAAIRNVNQAQSDYRKRFRRYAIDYPELIESLMMRTEPLKDKTCYDLTLRPAANAGSYTLLAEPVNPSSTKRFFFSDQTGLIRAETGKPASAQSPKVAG